MAADIHIKIDDIPGESNHKGHAGEIEVASFSWGMSQPAGFNLGSGGGTGKVSLSDLTFMHHVDKSSPNLMKYCCNGKHIKSAVLTAKKAGGAHVPYIKITLSDIIVSSVNQSASEGGGVAMESISLAFSKFKIDYQEQGQDGAAKGGPISADWDIKTNAAA